MGGAEEKVRRKFIIPEGDGRFSQEGRTLLKLPDSGSPIQ